MSPLWLLTLVLAVSAAGAWITHIYRKKDSAPMPVDNKPKPAAAPAQAVPVATHAVTNQVPPLENYNLFASDRALSEALEREGGSWGLETANRLGQTVGSAEFIALGFDANEREPKLSTHDRFGNRVDLVEFHPAYHRIIGLSVEYGIHSLPWAQERPGAHAVRAALMMLVSQNEAGHGCPISMTYSAVPALRKQPDLAGLWEPRIVSTVYDGRLLPAAQKQGVLIGMGMTEKQGGSDVRANTTRAVAAGDGGPGKEYKITGHKWFFSAPMCDAFLVLAQTGSGLSCFLVPRFREDGTRNALFIQRLKPKLGNRSNASSEVEFVNASGWLVGEEGRGVPTIIEMVNHTRLDCVISSAALMRQAVAQATHHAAHRSTFGKKLVEHPLMVNVLADLAIESEAATVLMMRLARAYDRRRDDESEDRFRRIATAVAKYWVCKRTPMLVAEALECLGGNGYVEESIMPRLFRESPLNSIWEGSGNVICLDVLRAMGSDPKSLAALFAEIESARGKDARFDRYVDKLKESISVLAADQSSARRLVELLATALQASLLLRNSPSYVADAFVASRLDGDRGHAFGTLPAKVDMKSIVERARPLA